MGRCRQWLMVSGHTARGQLRDYFSTLRVAGSSIFSWHSRARSVLLKTMLRPFMVGAKSIHDSNDNAPSNNSQTWQREVYLSGRALDVAQDWLIDHVADEDMQYAMHVRRRRGSHSATGRTGSS